MAEFDGDATGVTAESVAAHEAALAPRPQDIDESLLSSRVGVTPGQVDADLFPEAAEPLEVAPPTDPETAPGV